MTATPPLTTYVVAALFSDGALCVNALVTSAPEVATGMSVQQFISSGAATGKLTGIVAIPLNAEFLRSALRAIEGEGPAGRVVSLVPDPPAPEAV